MTRTLPLFPLRTVLFPGGPLRLRIFEPRYVDMVGRAMKTDTGFGVVLLVDGREAGAGTLTTATIGTEARIVDFTRLDDGLLGLTCIGRERLRIVRAWRQEDGLNLAEVEDLPPEPLQPVPDDCAHLPVALERLWPQLDEVYAHVPPAYADATWVGYRIAELAPLEPGIKQSLLELQDPLARLRELAPLLQLRDD